MDMKFIMELKEMGMVWLATYGVKLVIALVIFIIGKWISRRISNLAKRAMGAREVDPLLADFIANVAYYILLVAVIIAAVGQLGIETTSFLAILGSMGLAVGLALKDNLANFSSGVMLILLRPFSQGDFVTAGGVTGTVQTITLTNTVLHTGDNQKIIVPNAKITGDTITNVTANDTRRVDLMMGIGYGDDIKLAHKVIMDTITAHKLVLKDPAPKVAVHELGDSSVNFVVRPWCKTSDYWTVYWELTEQLKEAFDANDLSIPYPTQDLNIVPIPEKQ